MFSPHRVNVNLVVDISTAKQVYNSDYIRTSKVINYYLLLLLSKVILDRSSLTFADFFEMENIEFNEMFRELLLERVSENFFVNRTLMPIIDGEPRYINVIDKLHDSLLGEFGKIVDVVIYNTFLYYDHKVLMNISFINYHTLIVTFKLIKVTS